MVSRLMVAAAAHMAAAATAAAGLVCVIGGQPGPAFIGWGAAWALNKVGDRVTPASAPEPEQPSKRGRPPLYVTTDAAIIHRVIVPHEATHPDRTDWRYRVHGPSVVCHHCYRIVLVDYPEEETCHVVRPTHARRRRAAAGGV